MTAERVSDFNRHLTISILNDAVWRPHPFESLRTQPPQVLMSKISLVRILDDYGK